jgi:hypothetical protein
MSAPIDRGGLTEDQETYLFWSLAQSLTGTLATDPAGIIQWFAALRALAPLLGEARLRDLKEHVLMSADLSRSLRATSLIVDHHFDMIIDFFQQRVK